MGAGFYMMIAVSIVIFRLAVMDRKSGWVWAGVNLFVSLVLGRLFGLSVLLAVGAGFFSFFAMFVVNLAVSRGPD